MNWEIAQILFDFGLLILIWMVQLIIYPSFQFADQQQFRPWHNRYSGQISLFVIPLMFGQVGLYIRSLVLDINFLNASAAGLILAAWLLTFIWIVPVHNQLGKQLEMDKVKKLVNLNWGRTVAWTLVFGIDLALLSTSA